MSEPILPTSPEPSTAPEPIPPAAAQPAGRGGAALVALGIFSSRVIGLVREYTFAHFFGVGPHADVFRAALRAPNAIQNLLGEGTLSAAFIPLYTRMIHEGREEDAGRFAGAIFGLLLAAAASFSLLGVLLARPIVAVLSAGFLNDTGPVNRFELAVAAVRIIFPMTGFLVLSVWALGILNSHRKFLVPYIAPVVWNAAIIASLVWAGGAVSHAGSGSATLAALDRLLFAACWGALAGGLLQFLVQLPMVARVLRGFRLSFSTRVPGVRQALGAFGPVLAGRGVVQLAGYLDQFLASFLAVGAVSALGFAQMPYMLPISLFGMSIAAAELPELARLGGSPAELVPRVRRSLRQMAFLNVPTFVGYLAFGFLIVGLIYRTGRFTTTDQWLVYLVLCGYTSGLLATTSSRLLQNTFYALGETSVPARIAAWRVGLSALIAVPLMLLLDRVPVAALVAVPPGARALRLGAVGLSFASGVGAWFELLRLQAALAQRGATGALPWKETARLLLLAGAAAVAAAVIWRFLPGLHVALKALVVVGSFGLLYLGLARWLAAEELSFWIGRFGRRVRR
ncbi:MAG TPA: murein biosynthesis integral membrane protein MurJ [Thermoanaerobaculia bacterium]|nr:murein biosynthesis integral membrane protein MurJ [Thermoanaerobaculia bacterium]